MLELTPLEQAALKGQSTDKARAALEKEAEAQAKRAAGEQRNQAERSAEFSRLANLEGQRIKFEIASSVAKFVEPIQGYSPVITGLNGSFYVQQLAFEYEAEQRQMAVNQLTELTNGATDSINEKLAENATLAQSREPMDIGKIGLNIMDIDVLTGIVEKAKAQIEDFPPEYFNHHKQSWDTAVKAARAKALFATLETCESVMIEIMRDLRASGDISPNYYRQVKMPWK